MTTNRALLYLPLFFMAATYSYADIFDDSIDGGDAVSASPMFDGNVNNTSQSSSDSMFKDKQSTTDSEAWLDDIKKYQLEQERTKAIARKRNHDEAMKGRCSCFFSLCLSATYRGNDGNLYLDAERTIRDTKENKNRLAAQREKFRPMCIRWRNGDDTTGAEFQRKIIEIENQIDGEISYIHEQKRIRQLKKQNELNKAENIRRQKEFEYQRRRQKQLEKAKVLKEKRAARCREAWARKSNPCSCGGIDESTPAWVLNAATCAK